MKLIVHAGFHKTGSSSFQIACATSRGTLKEAGVCYPRFEGSSFETQHADLAFAVQKGDFEALEAKLEQIAEAANKDGARTVLLSSEEFGNLSHDPDGVNRLDEAFKARFEPVDYLALSRKLDALFKSHVRQSISHFGFNLWSDDYAKGLARHLVASQIRLKHLLGDRLRIRSYDQIAQSKNFCNGLLKACIPDLDEHADPIAEHTSNTSKDLKSDPYFVFAPLLRAAVARNQDGNPYSKKVQAELEKLLPRNALNTLTAKIDMDRIRDTLSKMIDSLAERALDTEGDFIEKEFGPDCPPDLAAALRGQDP